MWCVHMKCPHDYFSYLTVGHVVTMSPQDGAAVFRGFDEQSSVTSALCVCILFAWTVSQAFSGRQTRNSDVTTQGLNTQGET